LAVINRLYSLAKGKGKLVKVAMLNMSIGSGADPSLGSQHTSYTVMSPVVGCDPSIWTAVTFPAREHHHSLAGTKLHCLVTEAHVCKQLQLA